MPGNSLQSKLPALTTIPPDLEKYFERMKPGIARQLLEWLLRSPAELLLGEIQPSGHVKLTPPRSWVFGGVVRPVKELSRDELQNAVISLAALFAHHRLPYNVWRDFPLQQRTNEAGGAKFRVGLLLDERPKGGDGARGGK